MRYLLSAMALALLLAVPALAAGPGQSQQMLKATDDDGYTCGATSLGDYVADTLRQAAGTDLAFLPSDLLGLNLPAGAVDDAALEASLPRDEDVYVVRLTAPQLRQVLELSCSHLTLDGEEKLDRPASQWGGFLQLSGLQVIYNVPALVGQRVWSVTDDDRQELELEDSSVVYTAAVPASMLEGGGYGYAQFLSSDGQVVGSVRQLVAQRIAEEGVGRQSNVRRITLYGARENEIIDYFSPLLILFVVVLFALFGGSKWRRRATFER